MRNTIDFMVVGFGRCGTTTLFEHLKRHPDIFIPKYKECPFIAGETKTEYMRRHFPKGYKGKIIGAVTPQWMQYPELFHRWFPDAKVLMITRDKYDQAYSHYRMLYRRGEEKRDYDDAVMNEYIIDYNYWFSRWRKYIAVFMWKSEAMWYDDKRFMKLIYETLKVDSNFKPNSIGKVYNVGYAKMNPFMKFFKRQPIKHLIPQPIKRRIWWFLRMIGEKR